MKPCTNSKFEWRVLVSLTGLTGGLLAVAPLEGSEWPYPRSRGIDEVVVRNGGSDRAVIQTDDQRTAAEMVEELLGLPIAGVTVTDQAFSGAAVAGGTFSGGGANVPIGIEAGVILSTGDIAGVRGGTVWNQSDSITDLNRRGGDLDVSMITHTWSTLDAASLKFQVSSNVTLSLVFDYVFASDEYNEWVASPVNDGFGIWIREVPSPLKKNYARIPSRSDTLIGFKPVQVPVTVRNVNGGLDGSNALAPNFACFVNNDCDDVANGYPCNPNRETELDGLTMVVQSIQATLEMTKTYEVKIAIADGGDPYLDSAVFIKGYLGGSCCTSGPWKCVDGVAQSDCDLVGGTWSQSIPCIQRTDCGAATGACCLTDENCTVTAKASCHAGGGAYAGDNKPCGTTGACCFDDGHCLVMTEDCCTAEAGENAYQNDGTTCTPTGACHMGSDCIETTAICCSGAGGNFESGECPLLSGPARIPAVSEWGLVVMALLLLVVGTIIFSRRREVAPDA